MGLQIPVSPAPLPRCDPLQRRPGLKLVQIGSKISRPRRCDPDAQHHCRTARLDHQGVEPERFAGINPRRARVGRTGSARRIVSRSEWNYGKREAGAVPEALMTNPPDLAMALSMVGSGVEHARMDAPPLLCKHYRLWRPRVASEAPLRTPKGFPVLRRPCMGTRGDV